MQLSAVPGINLDEIVNKAIRNVYDRKIKAGDIDPEAWEKNARVLWKGAATGLEIKTGYQQPTNYELAAAMRRNLMVFAAFKNHSQTNDLVQLLVDENGEVRTFEQFKQAATPIIGIYNSNWLQSEYNTAVASAQAAVRWSDMQAIKESLPFLTYVTAGDERVRPGHALLNGVTLPIDDPFWDEWFPPNGWNCRCDVQQNAGPQTDPPKSLPDEKSVPLSFRNNPAKTGEVFTMQHPYFDLLSDEQRTNVMKATGSLIFKNYDQRYYFVSPDQANKAIKDVIGYDQETGGFVVVNKRHDPPSLQSESKALRILRDKGEMLELLDESTPGSKYDLFWENRYWAMKHMKSSANPRNTIRRYFRQADTQKQKNLLIHIDQDVSEETLHDALYNALRNNPGVLERVNLIFKGRILRLNAQNITQKKWE